ncbi:hypothetical protein AVEN_275309-1 [Araneus ventricosus]|uniref:DDE-1 domain-containing protein n=1 Tax=Araneus ventricosus TaxID=182803 RepID=A0A4Y1ZQP9_ARAVE|nr:hypothetical protein AVEN_156338-1 [Araneus ventricosus]GBN28981.1 hypothetical protein AVEN_275309-1 [Araneus ventricosus]
MDQGANSFKRRYRRVLLQRVVMGSEFDQPYETDVLSATHLSIRAWNDVQETTISEFDQPYETDVLSATHLSIRAWNDVQETTISEFDQPYETDVLSAMHFSVRAWNDVQETTISKAFQHAGFTTVIEESQENVPDDMGEDELLINELRKRNPLLHEISFQDFLSVDSDAICTDIK